MLPVDLAALTDCGSDLTVRALSATTSNWAFNSPPNGGPMNAPHYPPEYSRFFLYVIAMSLTGLVGILLLGVPATRTNNGLRNAYADDETLRGGWIIRWGWPIIVGSALFAAIAIYYVLFIA
jgi:hypothetical protein